MGFGPPPDGGPGARFVGAEAGMQGPVVKGAPFTADIVTESTQTLPDGNRIHRSSTVKAARDTEGRTRREQSPNMNGLATNTKMPILVYIHDPVAGVSMALNATDKTGTRETRTAGAGNPGGRGPGGRGPGGPHAAGAGPQQKSDAQRPHRTPANDPNFKTESLGTKSFDGVMAEGRRTTMTIPAGQMGNDLPIQIVTETWRSAELKTTVYEKPPTRATERPSPASATSAAPNPRARCSTPPRISRSPKTPTPARAAPARSSSSTVLLGAGAFLQRRLPHFYSHHLNAISPVVFCRCASRIAGESRVAFLTLDPVESPWACRLATSAV